jgi:hypothetical protein
VARAVGSRRRTGSRGDSSGEAAFTRTHWWWLAAAVLVAGLLRGMDLGTWSLWVDEAHTWRDATMPLEGENGFLSQDRALYPLTFLVVRGLMALHVIGHDEFWLRLPFALIGILTIPVLAFCGRRLVGPAAAVLAAWFCAINPWHIYWSQNARGYVLVCLLAPIAANRAAAWASSERNRDLFACLGSIGLGTLCHPTAALQAAGLLAFVWLRQVRELRAKTLLWIAVVVLAVTWLLPVIVADWSPFQGFQLAKGNPSLLHFVQTTAYYYRPVLLLAALVGLWWMHSFGGRSRALLLGCLCLVPFFVLLVIGGQIVKTTARYSICVFPVSLWLAAYLGSQLGQALGGLTRAVRPGMHALALLLPALLFADFAGETWSYYHAQQGDRAQWREACRAARLRAGDQALRVLTVGEPIAFYYLQPDHYSDPKGGTDTSVEVYALTQWELDGVTKEKVVLHPPGGRNHLLWHAARAKQQDALFAVIVTLPELLEMDDGQLWPTLQRDYELVLHLPCFVGPKDESIYVFVPREE